MQWLRKRNELDAEMEAHIQIAVEDRVARGEDAATARREVERELGNTALIKDVARESWGWVWLERLLQDVKYAWRQLWKSPAFATTVIATLALGIAAPAAMFTVVDRVLLRPLPYANAERLASIRLKRQDGKGSDPLYLDLQEWRRWSHSFDQIGFYHWAAGRSFLEGKTSTDTVEAYYVSSNLFRVLGALPELGRDFSEGKDAFAENSEWNNVILSDSAWRQMFGADPAILGKSVKINGELFLVIGVMPRNFSFPYDRKMPQIWRVARLDDTDKVRSDRSPHYSVIGRLRNGITYGQAQAELSTMQKQIALGYVDADTRRDSSAVELEAYVSTLVASDTQRALVMLLVASGVLWLIACVNATNLLLARAMARQREIAVRGALGAGRWRIIQQFMTEGMLLSGGGACLGFGLAILAVKLFARGLQQYLPFPVPAAPDVRIVVTLLLLSIISAILSSIWPAWISAHAPIEPALKQGGLQSGSARGQNRVRSIPVIVEIALSLTLLVGCGLLLRTIYALRHVPLGFRTDHIVVANLQIPSYKFNGQNMGANLYMPLIERIRHLPGVQAAGLMSEVPLGKTFFVQFTLYGKQGEVAGSASGTVNAKLDAVSPDMQKVFGFKMLAGRFFNENDTPASTPALVVNRAFVQAYAPQIQDMRKAIGMQIWHLTPKGRNAEIVGVLDDFHQFSVAANPQPELTVSLTQITPESGVYDVVEGIAMDIAIRSNYDPKILIPEIREALRQADPAMAGSSFTTMDQVVEDSFGSQQLAAHLLEIFGGSALLLCIAGLYGLLAYVVSQRTRELGVRLALGAQRGDLLWLVMRQAGVMLISGVVIGLALALASGRVVRSYLYGVSARDGWTLGAVAATLLLVGLLAAYLPARRAAMVDPMEALRAE
ncbi:MAG TPA: ABC transporter permease [Alloacidobacterium sp.]|nr:ABC transporter permease [Alloacidobacterium sp.]